MASPAGRLSGLMIIGGIAEIAFGVKAEHRRLEGIAKPLTAVGTAARSTVSRARQAATTHRRPGEAAPAAGAD